MLRSIIVMSCFLVSYLAANSNNPTQHREIIAEQEKLRDPDGFLAIAELHHLMDDDQSGSIDRLESADFLKEDMKIGGGLDRARREKAFHHNNDESITVDDLWESWFASKERAWSAGEVAEWLRSVVRLPQYIENFANAKVTGIALPRMATQNSSYILNVLGIKNFVHRQKLQLKALDIVLFGFQDASSRFKDIALAALLILLITVLVLFKTYRNRSERRMAELTMKFSELNTMETNFEGTEQRSNLRLVEELYRQPNEHIEELKTQLMEANRRIEMSGYDLIPFALQPLLRRTYELESSHIEAQKLECLSEMRDAKEFVDRMRRKQTGFFATFKIATGTSGGTEDIDSRIFALKARMEKIKMTVEECQQRWVDIESLCGFSIAEQYGSSVNLNGGLKSPDEGYGGAMSPDYDAVIHHPMAMANGHVGANCPESVTDFGDKIGGSRIYTHHLKHSTSQQQLRPSPQSQQKPLPSALYDSAIADTESLALSAAHGADSHIKMTVPAVHRQSIAHVIRMAPQHASAQFSEDSSSLSSCNGKGKKSKKLSYFLRRKLSKA